MSFTFVIVSRLFPLSLLRGLFHDKLFLLQQSSNIIVSIKLVKNIIFLSVILSNRLL